MEKITSRRNPICVHMKKLGASRVYREEYGEFLCDGLKLLEEAVKSSAEILCVLTSAHVPFPLPVDTRVYFTDRTVIDSVSPLKNAQNVLFSCKVPAEAHVVEQAGTHILLDSVQDPGNVGTVIRTASAFGIKSIILAGECADPYNPKTIRASMGAIFRQDIRIIDFQGLRQLSEAGVRFIASVSGEECASISETALNGAIIAIGNEGRGLGGEILSLCSEKIRIPIAPECESLNAAIAAAIIMWEAGKARF